ncbi:MAG: ornithine cyclodeaminase [Alistipes sp.]|jgi:ornithine cyclodeaminase|nr:ornithine cyclodeaminase [Alistipes sp.]
MKSITNSEIVALNISATKCVDWVREAFVMKSECQLPAKISVHPTGNDFFTTMPCLLPKEYGRFGAKVVSRIVGRVPALKSDMMLFDSNNGELLALVDCDWITAMRTGAVAALAIKTFRNSTAKEYAFIGLGSTARATLTCLLESCKDEQLNIRLFRYKDQAEKIVEEYKDYDNVTFTIVDNTSDLVRGADVVVSCITDASGLLVEDESLFKPGVLVVPVHTRGFQNCDTTFDKVYADDTDHVKGFKYFSEFREFHQIEEVLKGVTPGRESDTERILSYNIGLGLHDVLYASRIYDMLK